MSAHGGEPTPLSALEASGNVRYGWPQFLPDGDQFLFLARSTVAQESGIRIGSLETGSVSSPILQTGSRARYAAPGYLLFDRGGTLMAQRFDLERLDVTGDPVRVADSVFSEPVTGYTGFSTSDQGGLTYKTAAGTPLMQLRLLDRTGTELRTVGAPLPTLFGFARGADAGYQNIGISQSKLTNVHPFSGQFCAPARAVDHFGVE